LNVHALYFTNVIGRHLALFDIEIHQMFDSTALDRYKLNKLFMIII